MLKYDSFKPTVKYEITLCIPKSLQKKKILFFASYIKEKSSQSTKKRKAKYNELSNNLDINIRKKPIDLNIKKTKKASCSNFPFETLLSLSSYVGTESTDSFFSDLENE